MRSNEALAQQRALYFIVQCFLSWRSVLGLKRQVVAAWRALTRFQKLHYGVARASTSRPSFVKWFCLVCLDSHSRFTDSGGKPTRSPLGELPLPPGSHHTFALSITPITLFKFGTFPKTTCVPRLRLVRFSDDLCRSQYFPAAAWRCLNKCVL